MEPAADTPSWLHHTQPLDYDAIARHNDLIRIARTSLSAFMGSAVHNSAETGKRAQHALQHALAEGIETDFLAAALDVSPYLIRLIRDGQLDIASLHPGRDL